MTQRRRTSFDPKELKELFRQMDQKRVKALASSIAAHIAANLQRTVERKSKLSDYRTSPYVLTAISSVMNLAKPLDLARFLLDTKLYTGLETSFGKQIESAFVQHYPSLDGLSGRWTDPIEKLEEFAGLKGLTRETKASKRSHSVWREIDKECTVGDRRYLVSIKSGPHCINDTQVAGMVHAIKENYLEWLQASKKANPKVKGIDVVIGLTYGTPATTNNKENQILVKLRGDGFEPLKGKNGVLVDKRTKSVRVYRAVGIDFWSFIGDPRSPNKARHTFLEALLALSLAMRAGEGRESLLDSIQARGIALARAIEAIVLSFPQSLFPKWAHRELSDDEFLWLSTAITSFYDEGV